MTEPYDLIRVLLIDDKPKSLCREYQFAEKEYIAPRIAEVRAPFLREWFQLRWIATAKEAREFRDLATAVALRDPQALGEAGWVPEILCFDYALTGDDDPVHERSLPTELVAEISPLPALRERAALLGVSVPLPSDAPETGAAPGEDSTGCYAGGLLFTTFSDHPCAPVAMTRKTPESIENTEASFFEWFLKEESHGTFEARGNNEPSWLDLISQGVKALRSRLEQLARGSVINLSLTDLLTVAETGLHTTLTFSSRYATRRLPVAALFLDIPEADRTRFSKSWAVDRLTDVYRSLSVGDDFAATRVDLAKASEIASQLWAAYTDNGRMIRRLRLSELLLKSKGAAESEKQKKDVRQPRTDQEQAELDGHARFFGINDPDRPGRQGCQENALDIRTVDASPLARRWACLMIVVRLLALRSCASRRLDELREEHREYGEQDAGLLAPLHEDDVFLALFPLAQTPLILPFHADTSPTVNWGVVLRRWRIDGQPPLPTARSSRLGESRPQHTAPSRWHEMV